MEDMNNMPHTYVGLKDYFDMRLLDLEKTQALAHLSTERALTLANSNMDKRLDGMNEFRDTLRDQASKFITRDEIAVLTKTIEADLRELRSFKDILNGKANHNSVLIMQGTAIIAAILSVISLILNFK